MLPENLYPALTDEMRREKEKKENLLPNKTPSLQDLILFPKLTNLVTPIIIHNKPQNESCDSKIL